MEAAFERGRKQRMTELQTAKKVMLQYNSTEPRVRKY